LAAGNSAEFCLLQDDGSCTATQTWTVIPSEVEANLSFVFENLEAGVPHNVVITDLEGTPDDPRSGGETYAASTLITGVDTDYFVSDSFTWEDLPEQWYFFCAIHPNMKGVGQVVQAG
jgi:plastocyanin